MPNQGVVGAADPGHKVKGDCAGWIIDLETRLGMGELGIGMARGVSGVGVLGYGLYQTSAWAGESFTTETHRRSLLGSFFFLGVPHAGRGGEERPSPANMIVMG